MKRGGRWRRVNRNPTGLNASLAYVIHTESRCGQAKAHKGPQRVLNHATPENSKQKKKGKVRSEIRN